MIYVLTLLYTANVVQILLFCRLKLQFMNKAVFIDRDGVINSDEGHYYIFRPDDFILNPEIANNLKKLQEAGFKLIIITNQGGIAKGIYTASEVEKLHDYMLQLLYNQKVIITDVFYCPHHDAIGKCLCRKPKPLMIQKSAAKYNIDLDRSWFIGDNDRDMEAASLAGVKGIKVKANTDIKEAVDQILNS